MQKDKIKQVPVYLLPEKYEKIKELASAKRQSLTRWLEDAADVKIKKEDK